MFRISVFLGLTLPLILALPASGQECEWTHWAAPWSGLNLGDPPNPGVDQFPANNWDYSLNQMVDGGAALDVPSGGGTLSFHWFLGPQSPDFSTNKEGSGGIYQEIAVTPGIPLEFSYYWKGATNGPVAWFEFLLIDGPFTTAAADQSPTGNIIRKRVDSSFSWEQITESTPGYQDAPTITPTQNTVTVVFKAGRGGGAGRVELFVDNVLITQNNGANVLLNEDFEDGAQATICDDKLVEQDSNQSNYYISVPAATCDAQHTVTGVSPLTAETGNTLALTVNGTNLEEVVEVQLIPAGGGSVPTIVSSGVTVGPGPGETSLVADMPIVGAHYGNYIVRTIQDLPCLNQQAADQVTLICPDPSPITAVTPTSVTDPGAAVQITISGPDVTSLTEVTLRLGDSSEFIFTDPAPVQDGSDMIATFDLSCAPAGVYQLTGCGLDRNFTIYKSTPAQTCDWQPWAAAWSTNGLILGDDLDPPNNIYDAANWDYDLSQETNLNLARTPHSGSNALHWFLDTQPPDAPANEAGSGGFYQEFAVTPGTPVNYSFWWKGKCEDAANWYEMLLIDGPFSIWDADQYQESATANNPYMIRKRELSNTMFDWEEITHDTAADVGPAGPRPQTITPSGNIVTIVFKAGHNGGSTGATELFLDDVSITQGVGPGLPELIANGDMESSNQINICNAETVFQASCEDDFYLRSDFIIEPPLVCNAPFADADDDDDIDQDDFAVFQLCYTGDGVSPPPIPSEPEYCGCFDRDSDDAIGAADFTEFANCTTGPDVPHATHPNPSCSEQP